MYILGAILLLAAVLSVVIAFIDSVFGLVKIKDLIAKIPVVGEHWGLIVSVLMVWLLSAFPAAGWGVAHEERWINIVFNGALIYGAIPLKDAVVALVKKGLSRD